MHCFDEVGTLTEKYSLWERQRSLVGEEAAAGAADGRVGRTLCTRQGKLAKQGERREVAHRVTSGDKKGGEHVL